MSQLYHETVRKLSDLGIQIAYLTTPGGYDPLHWHEELEILYALNGETDIIIEGKNYKLPKKHMIVIESCQVHSSHFNDQTRMIICIHICKKRMKKYLQDIELYEIHCIPEDIDDKRFPHYLKICQILESLTKLYIDEPPTLLMESEGLTLQILSHLIRYFSTNTVPQISNTNQITMERLREVITYVEQHFRDPISLQEISDRMGLRKEYFCRFFKKNMGLSFLQYVNEVRITHIYKDLSNTDTPISELMEKNGFMNQKLFNRMFKQLYGCTPSSVRKFPVSLPHFD